MDDSEKMQRPTLRDIAKELGLGSSTVSMALKDHPRVAKATRELVKRTALEMGYVPDPRLSTVMSYLKTKRVDKPVAGMAYISAIPADTKLEHHPVYHQYFLGAKKRSLELGYRLESFNLTREKLSGARLNSILRGRGIEGILISPFLNLREQLDIDYSKIRAITFGYSLEKDGINRVTIDQYLGVLRSLEEIAKYGYKRIGFVVRSKVNLRMQYRWGAALAAFQEYNPDQAPIPRLDGGSREDFLKWRSKYKPDALFCHGLDGPFYLHEEGLVCGRDYGFATIAQESLETQASLYERPGFARQLKNAAGLNQGSFYIGGLAVELLAQDLALNLKGLSPRPKVTLVEGEWIEGDTLIRQG